MSLVATTRRHDGPLDLLEAGLGGALFVRDRVGLGSSGVARRVALHEAGALLRSITTDDEVGVPGTGPVALGVLPFVPGRPAELVIPALVAGRAEDGTQWVTAIADGPVDPVASLTEALVASRAVEPPDHGPGSYSVASARPPADWVSTVSEAVARIRSGALEKAVLAREVIVTADADIDADAVLGRLAAAYPGCFLYSVDGWVGASPELLVSRHLDQVRAQPMAGTTARRGDPQADARAAAALLASPTYRHEHQVTIDMVHDTLLQFSSYLDYEAEPTVVALANVAHLATLVQGRLSHPPASVLELVEALHPTPAVCGRPRQAALDLIGELEHLDRDRYAGAVGWVDAGGNGQWAVAIRCAHVSGRRARVFAGNGIVADSDPVVELAETRAKLQAVLGAIVRP